MISNVANVTKILEFSYTCVLKSVNNKGSIII